MNDFEKLIEDDRLDAQERQLVEKIREIQREYEQVAKPYVDRLVYIRSIRPPAPIYYSVTMPIPNRAPAALTQDASNATTTGPRATSASDGK